VLGGIHVEAKTDWSQVIEDYNVALVRLALARVDGKFHLLMGYIELFPRDTPCPETFYAEPWKVPEFRGAVFHVGATRMDTAAALAWYEAAASGTLTLPEVRDNKPLAIVAPPLGAEPALGEFLLDDHVSFSPQWHGNPRIHRLVPLGELDGALTGLEEKTEAREWLAANFGFDPLGDEEWRGSLSILAPDPLLEGVQHYIQETHGDGAERVVFYAKRRRFPDYPTADADALSLVTYERRPSGWSHAGVLPLDKLGFLVVDHSQPVSESGYTITCPKRGLLRLLSPVQWLRAATLSIRAVEQRIRVQVDEGGRRKPGTEYDVERVTALGPTTAGRSLSDLPRVRIAQLRSARAARLLKESAPQRIFGITGAKEEASEAQLETARASALEYVVDLVKVAEREVVFVDVDWSLRETQNYAHRVAQSGVKVQILTSRRIFDKKMTDDSGDEKPDSTDGAAKDSLQVYWARQTLEYLEGVHSNVYGADIEVRVMPGSSKPAFHDRFLVVDESVWCCGPSFNELGERIGVISRSQMPAPLLAVIRDVWDRSTPMLSFDPEFAKRPIKSRSNVAAQDGGSK
jgi:hypothetical protein